MKVNQRVTFTKDHVVGSWADQHLGIIPAGATGTVHHVEDDATWIQMDKTWLKYDRITWHDEDWVAHGVEMGDADMKEFLR